MNNSLLDFSKFETPTSKFNAVLGTRGGYINFSNSGKGIDKKHFTLGLDSFLMILKDIYANITLFSGHESYVEKEWRDLGSTYYSDGPSNAMSTVQTKPLFSTLSKIILWANLPSIQPLDPEQKIDLTPTSIQNAILKLSELAESYTPNSISEATKLEIRNWELILEENTIRDFALNVFMHFFGENWLELLNQTTSKPSNINSNTFLSRDFNIFVRLIAEFSTSQTKESLTSSNTQRYFETPILQIDNRYFYFTTQWNGTGEYGLSYNSLKSFFESTYPNYKFEKTYDNYRMYRLGEIQGKRFDYKSFHQITQKANLFFSEKLTARFVASLCTKPFVICTGLSGSGKTKLAQSFVQWICESKEQYKIVPVGADWTNREPLLGFPNGLDELKYVFPDSGALQLMINALKPENENKPHFLILDEMNLSHVERYFADFLSIMESKDEIKLYSGADRKCPEGHAIDKEVSWPKNLFIIGTVNIDETTYMFSPKVLDRANVIEFRVSETDMEAYLKSSGELNMNKFFVDEDKEKAGIGSNMAADFLEKAKRKATPEIKTEAILVEFFNKLEKAGAEFGYRSASEINRLVAILEALTETDKKWDEVDIDEKKDFIDIAIMQKLLPKLHGSRNKMTKVLPVIGGLCLEKDEKIKENYFEKFDSIALGKDDNVKYKLSFAKICRMYKSAVENGYASYAEA